MKKPFLFLLFWCLSVSAIQIQPVSLVPQVLTYTSLANFDLSGSGGGAQVFNLIFFNQESKDWKDLSLDLKILFKEPGASTFTELFYGSTLPFNIGAEELSVTAPSSEIFSKNSSSRFVRRGAYHWKDNDPYRESLINRTISSGSLVSGELKYSIVLKQNEITLDSTGLVFQIMQISQLQLLTPGQSADGALSGAEAPLVPLFQWSSDLAGVQYSSGSKYTFEVWEDIPGASPSEIISRTPYFKTQVQEEHFNYPPAGARVLKPGKAYLWRVRANLQGIGTSSMASEVYRFRTVSLNANPQIQNLKNQLRTLLASTTWHELLSQLEGYDMDYRIFSGNLPADEQLLQDLISGVNSGKIKITGASVE